MPLISICVINYNGTTYLEDCINSILNQTYPHIEIVFCDDASSDSSIEIFESLISGKSVEVVRQYNPINLGVEGNMLTGLRAFTGEYVCNIDCDDVLLPNHIETLYRLILDNNADIGCTNHINFETKVPEISVDREVPKTQIITTKESIETFYLKKVHLPFAYWHRLYKRENALKVALLPDEVFLNSDSSFSVAQFCYANTVAYADTPTYLYRIQPDSVSHKSWYSYVKRKTLGSLDNISETFKVTHPHLIRLNNMRNAIAVGWILDSAIKEQKGADIYLDDFKKFVNWSNQKNVINEICKGNRTERVIFFLLLLSPKAFMRHHENLLKRKAL